MALFAGGAFLVLAVLVWFKSQYAPTSELIAAQNTMSTTERLTDFSRYVSVHTRTGLLLLSLRSRTGRFQDRTLRGESVSVNPSGRCR